MIVEKTIKYKITRMLTFVAIKRIGDDEPVKEVIKIEKIKYSIDVA